MTSGPKKSKQPKSATKTQQPPPPPREPDGSGAFDFIHFFTNAKVRRETIEMVAFVLVLVCFLRLFGAEAYVIPTGSMATTLLGAYKSATCPECGHFTFVNASAESEYGVTVNGGLCQNCMQKLQFGRGDYHWGDRILADKLIYELRGPRRWEVAVFKYPNGVDRRYDRQRRLAAVFSARTNYIKRVVGLPGETVGIQYGDIFVQEPGQSEFQIARKPPRVAMATRRLVFDNDQQPVDLVEAGVPPRWAPQETKVWTPSEDGKSFSTDGAADGWIVYRHLLRPYQIPNAPDHPLLRSLILDFEAYDSDMLRFNEARWVGDLMLECDIEPESNEGSLILELVEATRVFRCVFDMATNKVTLWDGDQELATAENPLRQGRTTQVRLANFDDRLILWVGGNLIFGDGVDVAVPQPHDRGPTPQDLAPARIGSTNNAATVSAIKLFRDIYYLRTISNRPQDQQWAEPAIPAGPLTAEAIESNRESWNRGSIRPFQVGPTEFFPLGDNSLASADARDWSNVNVVDQRLLLGRAVARYWPVIGWEGNWPVLRWKFVE